MGSVTVWIDGAETQAEAGRSILDAALAARIYIPHLCHHPDLPPQGECKLCVVEIEGEAEPVTACTTEVREGMRVTTKSARLGRLRKASMEFMLAGHPGDCTGCRSYGSCELQAMMQYLSAVANGELRTFRRKSGDWNTNNPLIDREMERCIQCGRCVGTCGEWGFWTIGTGRVRSMWVPRTTSLCARRTAAFAGPAWRSAPQAPSRTGRGFSARTSPGSRR